MKTHIYKKRIFQLAVIVVVMDGLFFGLTNPNNINPVFLILGFILVGLTVYVTVRLVIAFLTKMGFKIKNRRKIILFVVALACLLLALQSIGQLSARDVLIIVPLSVLLYIYLAYIRPRTLI